MSCRAHELVRAGRRVAGLRLIVIADESLVDSPIPIDFVPWSEEAESAALMRGDIGIAPTPEDRWTLGKCGFKIVQYMAAGLPVIASPVGANKEIVVENQTGFLPTEVRGWADSVAKLAGNVEMRQEMGAAGRRRVEEQFSVERAAAVWAGLLSEN